MHARKKFVEGVDVMEFSKIQEDLPDCLKMHILVCEHDGQAVSALIASLIGKVGIGIIGATGNKGLNLGAFHWLNIKLVEWMKNSGANRYNFGGYNPDRNPGTASFKAGLPGKESRLIGEFKACESAISWLLVKWGDIIKTIILRSKATVNRAQNVMRSKRRSKPGE